MIEVIQVCGVRYHVKRLLGKGKGGYSYLAHTPQMHEVVLKQIHHEPCDYYTFGNKMAAELADYERLRAIGLHMPRLIAADRGTERLVKEYIPGPTVYELVLQDELPDWCTVAVEDMCEVLYSAGLNIDYFPTNFIPYAGVLYYVDYEANVYDPKWDFQNWGRAYWSRTPELLAYAHKQTEAQLSGPASSTIQQVEI